MKLVIYLAGCGLLMTACTSTDSTPSASQKPSTVYEQYNDKVIHGIAYEEEKIYFSNAKRAEVESKIPQYMQQMKKSREQVIQMYQKVSQSVAKCKKIRLTQERIEGNIAYLTYEQTDICNPSSGGQQKQSVVMHNEQGWKIHQVEIAL